MRFYGQLEKAQLEVLGADPAVGTVGRIWFNTVTGAPKVDDGTTIKKILTGTVSLTTEVSGTLPIGNGGTGQTTAGPAFNALAPATAKGGLVAGTAANTYDNLAVGTNGLILSANSAQTTGLEWVANVPLETVVSRSANDTVDSTETVLFLDSSGGAFTETLYAISGTSGKKVTFKKTSSDSNIITIDANASETIDDRLTIYLYVENDFVTLVSNGTTWKIVAKSITIAARYTGTASTTPSSLSETVIKYSTKVYDASGSPFYDTGTGLFTVPVHGAGKYEVHGFVNVSAAAGAVSNAFEMHVYAGGSSKAKRYQTAFTTTSVEHGPFIISDVTVSDGQTIGVYIGQNLSGSPLSISNDVHTFIDIRRVGN